MKEDPHTLSLRDRFGELPKYAVDIGGYTGMDIKMAILRQGAYMNPPANEVLEYMRAMRRPTQITAVKFMLGDLFDITYDYGFDGLEKIVRALEMNGLTLCPKLTGPILCMHNRTDILDAKENVKVLSNPIGNNLLFLLSKGKPRLALNAYSIGAFYHDTTVIARIKSITE